jgi:hypothetical protein
VSNAHDWAAAGLGSAKCRRCGRVTPLSDTDARPVDETECRGPSRTDPLMAMAQKVVVSKETPERAILARGRAIVILDCGHVTGRLRDAETTQPCEWCRVQAEQALKDHGMKRGDGL